LELTVVGAGVGGSALKREAEARGHAVRLLSHGEPVSEVALAVVRESYVDRYPSGKEAARYALAQYAAAGVEVVNGADVTTFMKPGAEPVHRDDWNAVNPRSGYLLAPDEDRWVPEGWDDPDAFLTIWASGAALPGKTSFGGTWVNEDPEALDVRFAIHQYAPYRTADAVRYADHCRLGSSMGTTAEGAVEGAHKIMAIAAALGWVRGGTTVAVPEGWKLLVGIRVERERIAIAEDGRVTFGGFHRDGWGLAPFRALQLVERLEAITK